MNYKEVHFCINFKSSALINYNLKKKVNICYKAIDDIFNRKTVYNFYLHDKKSDICKTPRKMEILNEFNYKEISNFAYKSYIPYKITKKEIDYHNIITRIFNFKPITLKLQKKQIYLSLEYNEALVYDYEREKNENIDYDILKSENLNTRVQTFVEGSIMINLFYCSKYCKEIFELNRSFVVSTYEKKDNIFYKLDNNFVLRKGKPQKGRKNYVEKIKNELDFHYISKLFSTSTKINNRR